jgi:hypothetical protein
VNAQGAKVSAAVLRLLRSPRRWLEPRADRTGRAGTRKTRSAALKISPTFHWLATLVAFVKIIDAFAGLS